MGLIERPMQLANDPVDGSLAISPIWVSFSIPMLLLVEMRVDGFQRIRWSKQMTR